MGSISAETSRSTEEKTLQDAEVETFWRDGAIVLRNVISQEWISRLRAVIDELMVQSAPDISSVTSDGKFLNGSNLYMSKSEVKAFIFDEDVAGIAQRFLKSEKVNFFYDQLLIKEPGSVEKTLWHHDLAFWPVDGDQIISIWVPLDRATPENGVVSYVQGSHRWGKLFRPQFVDDTINGNQDYPGKKNSLYEPVPDIDGDPEKYKLLTWSLDPGDVLIHHALTLHGAPGNLSTSQRRRAWAFRWFGDDVVFHRRPGDSLDRPGVISPLKDGDPVDSPFFPRVLPR